MSRAHRFQLEADITCPECRQRIPMQAQICPRCEVSLH